jgi:hypothetical protein
MALHNITASGNQLVIELIVTEGDYAPSLITLKNPSIKLTTDRIKFLDSGVYQTALRFTDINEIGGVAPTDLEEAADLISALIANFSGGGSAPTYKVYTALLSQSGTDAPVATVLENTLGVTPTYGYSSAGDYTLISAGFFTEDKKYLFQGQVNNFDDLVVSLERNDDDTIRIATTGFDRIQANELMYGQAFIEIRVYN